MNTLPQRNGRRDPRPPAPPLRLRLPCRDCGRLSDTLLPVRTVRGAQDICALCRARYRDEADRREFIHLHGFRPSDAQLGRFQAAGRFRNHSASGSGHSAGGSGRAAHGGQRGGCR